MTPNDDVDTVRRAQDLLLDFIAKTPGLTDVPAACVLQALVNTGVTIAVRVGAANRLLPELSCKYFAEMLESQVTAIRESGVVAVSADGEPAGGIGPSTQPPLQ